MSDANCATPGSSVEFLKTYPFQVSTNTVATKSLITLIEYSTIPGNPGEYQLLKSGYLYSFAVNFTVNTPDFSENGLIVYLNKSANEDMSSSTSLIINPCAYQNNVTMDCCFNGNFITEPNMYYAFQIYGNTSGSLSQYQISATRLSAVVEISQVP